MDVKSFLGAVALSKDFYKLLEAKHIQLDSIGYLLLRHYSTCGQVIQLSLHYDELLKFFTGNYKNVRRLFAIESNSLEFKPFLI